MLQPEIIDKIRLEARHIDTARMLKGVAIETSHSECWSMDHPVTPTMAWGGNCFRTFLASLPSVIDTPSRLVPMMGASDV